MENRIVCGTEECVKRLPFWGDLTDGERAAIAADVCRRHYGKGEQLNGGSVHCLGTVFVLQGGFRVSMLSEEGREITLFRVGTGDTCVLSASCVISQLRFETVMETECETELLIVGSTAFRQLTEENLRVRCFMYELATERFSQVVWALQDVLFLRLDQRLARFLVAEYERTGTRELYLTQDEIARQINSAREVVARTLRQFAENGLVRCGRGHITLTDTDALRNLL